MKPSKNLHGLLLWQKTTTYQRMIALHLLMKRQCRAEYKVTHLADSNTSPGNMCARRKKGDKSYMHIIFFKLTSFIIKLNEAKNIGLGCFIYTIFISILSGAALLAPVC